MITYPKLIMFIFQTISSIETKVISSTSEHKLCNTEPPDECSLDEQRITMLPLILIFCTRFVLGIGFTLYVTLGTPYLDDGVKRKHTPIMLATAFTFKMLGSFAFILVNISLRMFVDPWSTPVITQDDPRWIGAWWFGYIVLGIGMAIVSLFIGIFPEQLPCVSERNTDENKINKENIAEEMVSLQNKPKSETTEISQEDIEIETFIVALRRLIGNKLVVFKLTAEVFYVIAGTGIVVYYSKFMEVMFNRSPSDASIVTGPMEMVLTISSYYLAACIIGNRQPSYRKLILSSIFVSCLVFTGFLVNVLLPCDTSSVASQFGSFNLTTNCNQHCTCEEVSFSPVCDTALKTTFFSPCHAGCTSWNQSERTFGGCSCAASEPMNSNSILPKYALNHGACFTDCTSEFFTYVIMFSSINAIGAGVNIGRALIDMR